MTVVLENFQSEVDAFAHFRSNNFELLTLDNGNKHIESFPVFRTGTFKDSMGESRTWGREHLAQMVSNFKNLRDSEILENIPVRDGHPGLFGGGAPGSGPGRVVGYVTDLRVGDSNADGETLLVADFEFTEPDAVEKFQRGTFRARSSEIGMYETNDEALHWPVFLGFAFVDIGAVEKLFGKSWTSNHFTLSEDNAMGTKPKGDDDTIDLTNETDDAAGETADVTDDVDTSHDTHTHSSGNSAGDVGGNFTFRIGGEPTTDFAAVQQHVDHLESIQREMVDSARNDFVTQLAEDGVIAATKVDDMQEFVRTMSTDQYNKFTEMYKDAPPNALFAHHAGVTNEDGTEGTNESASESDEMEILEQRVEYARKSGLDEESLKKLDSYQRLQELKASQD